MAQREYHCILTRNGFDTEGNQMIDTWIGPITAIDVTAEGVFMRAVELSDASIAEDGRRPFASSSWAVLFWNMQPMDLKLAKGD